jgi:hypothetical protein
MAVPSKCKVLILGGYGVFGGRLAAALIKDARFDVIVAGRDQQTAETFCAQHGGRTLVLDRDSGNLAAEIAAQKPNIVVDAAGPYQSYRDNAYKVVEAAIACGAHYLDLSDDAEFTSGIVCMDARAKAKGVAVLSGASSVPAISSAVADALSSDLKRIHLIESVILPGNRAPRGMSVMRAILGQAGRPMQLWRGGRASDVPGWSGLTRLDLTIPGKPPLSGRWASYIGAPDLKLFPHRYGAFSVLFRAGLELKVMHGGLSILTGLVRVGLMRSLTSLARPLKWVADRLESFGTDRGGMRVRIIGETIAGDMVQRDWTLIAEAGDGLCVPTVASRILCSKFLAGEVEPGARACLGEFTLQETETVLATLNIATHRLDTPFAPVFAKALGQGFARLPRALQDLHTLADMRTWSGRSEVIRSSGFLSRLAGAIVGFPPSGRDVPVTVTMHKTERGEVWTRQFGASRFRSHLAHAGSNGSGRMMERFGLLNFELALSVENGKLHFPVSGGACLGVPIPSILLPKSDTFEFSDSQGRACFDVSISLPLAGHVVTYRGWLTPADGDAVDASRAGAPLAEFDANAGTV